MKKDYYYTEAIENLFAWNDACSLIFNQQSFVNSAWSIFCLSIKIIILQDAWKRSTIILALKSHLL